MERIIIIIMVKVDKLICDNLCACARTQVYLNTVNKSTRMFDKQERNSIIINGLLVPSSVEEPNNLGGSAQNPHPS